VVESATEEDDSAMAFGSMSEPQPTVKAAIAEVAITAVQSRRTIPDIRTPLLILG
jgi:hypothetical protein